MTSSQTTSLLSEVNTSKELSRRTLRYFRGRLVNHVYALFMREFTERQDKFDFKQSDLARRIQKDPGYINRLLKSPRNWTLETLSDLMLGLGIEPVFNVARISEENVVEINEPDWLRQSTIDFDEHKSRRDSISVKGPSLSTQKSNVIKLDLHNIGTDTDSVPWESARREIG